MAKQLQLRRGTTTQHNIFTGAVGEVTIDTDKDVVVVHDGATVGGFPSQKQLVSGTNIKTINGSSILASGNLDLVTKVSSIAELASLDGTTPTVIVTDLDRGGTFIWSASGTANGGTVFAGATGYWNRQYDGAVNVKWFGANSTRVDNEVMIQMAINAHDSVFIPGETFKISNPIVLTKNIFKISGVKGKTVLMGTGGANIFGYFQVNKQYYADFGNISNITFDSDDYTKERYAIHSTSSNYIIHWKIEECNFNARLTGGIIGNLIACHIFRCYFGVYFAGAGRKLIAIKSIGAVVPIATTNINIIEQCEFKQCGTPENIVEFKTGAKVVFRDCIFEQLQPNLSVVKLTGILHPIFDGCWFEDANGVETVGKCVIYTEKDENNISCEVLTVENCLFHTFENIPEGLINMGDSSRKHIEFKKNQMTWLKSPIIVGGNSEAKFLGSYGNTATVQAGGDVTGLQYDSPALFDLGVLTPVVTLSAVKFPTTPILSSNVNVLDDYKEGLFTPADSSSDSLILTISSGRFTKIGNLVSFTVRVKYPINTGTEHAILSGLPYTVLLPTSASISSDSGITLQTLLSGTSIAIYPPGRFEKTENSTLSGKNIYISGSYLTT